MFEHRAVNIDVNQHGQFVADVGEVQVTAYTLIECQGAIDKELNKGPKPEICLDVFGVVYRQDRNGNKLRGELTPAKVIGFNRTTRDAQFSGVDKNTDVRHVVPDTPNNRKILGRWLDALVAQELAKKELDKVRVEWGVGYWGVGYECVTIDEYDGLLEHAKKRYEMALCASLEVETSGVA